MHDHSVTKMHDEWSVSKHGRGQQSIPCPPVPYTAALAAHLEDDRGDLLQERRGRYLGQLRLLDRRDTGDKVHLLRLPDLGPLGELPTKVQQDEERDVDVCGGSTIAR